MSNIVFPLFAIKTATVSPTRMISVIRPILTHSRHSQLTPPQALLVFCNSFRSVSYVMLLVQLRARRYTHVSTRPYRRFPHLAPRSPVSDFATAAPQAPQFTTHRLRFLPNMSKKRPGRANNDPRFADVVRVWQSSPKRVADETTPAERPTFKHDTMINQIPETAKQKTIASKK